MREREREENKSRREGKKREFFFFFNSGLNSVSLVVVKSNRMLNFFLIVCCDWCMFFCRFLAIFLTSYWFIETDADTLNHLIWLNEVYTTSQPFRLLNIHIFLVFTSLHAFISKITVALLFSSTFLLCYNKVVED